MSALTDGPFGPGNRPPAMPDGDFLDREPSDGAVSGIMAGDVFFGLEGQPPASRSHGWGDMSWMGSPFYQGGRLTGVGIAVHGC